MSAEQPIPLIAAELWHDLRSTASKTPGGYRKRPRPWSKVTGVCLHQTACHMGERPGRYAKTGAHVIVTRQGQVIWLHDFDQVVVHGHGWNAQTVGIEVDGLYEGVEGDPRTVWDDPSTKVREQGMTLTDATVQSLQAVIRWIVAEVARNGGKVSALVAHRQSIDDRRNDPGGAIWRRVALPMSAELGLTDGGDGFKLGKGRPIPREWDPSRTAKY